ncbi:outer membrane beta-barrel protein [Flavobacterium pallidum]|uniref:Outer membrane protein beta-barrel domain-containing protein n=1 Tax=Flavobacterium pallidum TaxID=2172098 RepID=A0A2S1SL07_9FLAO|nr:outer membrane beta-barrel protein [Flavobacterium pallidum]AWI27093.1 hypothetical protein HYN49_14935 [Flavobacterium pallidum]
MKKIILSAVALLAFGFANAQEAASTGTQTAKGKWLIEANTGFGAIRGANTSFSYNSQGDIKEMNLGAEAGYFIMDNLAIKAGIGYNSFDDGTVDGSGFAYKIGAKYYILGMIPVQVDYTGASGDIYEAGPDAETPSYLGVQAGYAWFLGENVSIEPGVRYNSSLNDKYTEDGMFQVCVGFALHF